MLNEQLLLNKALEHQSKKHPWCYLFQAEFIPNHGWYAMTPNPRFHGDTGEFLGRTFKEAIASANNIYGLNTWGNRLKENTS